MTNTMTKKNDKGNDKRKGREVEMESRVATGVQRISGGGSKSAFSIL